MKLFTLILVVTSFIWLVCWVFLPSNRARFEAHGSLPLEDDSLPEESPRDE